MGYLEIQFVKSLLLTVAVESAVIAMMVRYYIDRSFSWERILFAGIFPSFATLPYAWFVFPLLFPHSYLAYVWFSEVTVALFEIVILYMVLKLSWKEALVLSLCANAASFGSGLFLNHYVLF